MRVTHYIPNLRTSGGGTTTAVLDMCTQQARAGWDVNVVIYDQADAPGPWLKHEPGCPRLTVLPPPPALPFATPRQTRTAWEEILRNTDVLHLHALWDPREVLISRTARAMGVPYVQSPHGMLADWSVRQKRLKKTVYTRLYGRALIDGAQFIHLTAQAELDQSAKRHAGTRGFVIPLLFNLDPYRERPTPEPARRGLDLPPPEHPTLLYLSRLHVKKRPDLLVKAARPLRDMGLKFNVVLAGPSEPAYTEEVMTIARRLGVDDITRYLGMVPGELKPSLYASSDLFVLPTHMENFGFVYFESLACATPLLTTKGTDTWRELEGSGGGTIVERIPGGDEQPWIDTMARTLADLLRDRDALRRRGEAGRRWVFQWLDPARIVAQYAEMYGRAMRGAK